MAEEKNTQEGSQSGGYVAKVAAPYSSFDVPGVGTVTTEGLQVNKTQADKIKDAAKTAGVQVTVSEKKG